MGWAEKAANGFNKINESFIREFPRTAKAMTDAGKHAQAYARSLRVVGGAAKEQLGIWGQMARQKIPALDNAVRLFEKGMSRARDSIDNLAARLLKQEVSVIKAQGAYNLATQSLKAFGAELWQIAKVRGPAYMVWFRQIGTAIAVMLRSLGKPGASFLLYTYSSAIGALGKSMFGIKAAARSAADAQQVLIESTSKLGNAAKDTTEKLGGFAKSVGSEIGGATRRGFSIIAHDKEFFKKSFKELFTGPVVVEIIAGLGELVAAEFLRGFGKALEQSGKMTIAAAGQAAQVFAKYEQSLISLSRSVRVYAMQTKLAAYNTQEWVDWSDKLATSVGVNASEMRYLTTRMLDVLGSMGLTEEHVKAFIERMVDLEAEFHMGLPKTIVSAIAAMRGFGVSAFRLGVDLTKVDGRTRKLAETVAKAAGDIAKAGDKYYNFAAIMTQTSELAGRADQQLTTMAGSISALAQTLELLYSQIGKATAEYFKPYYIILREIVVAISDFSAHHTSLVGNLGMFFGLLKVGLGLWLAWTARLAIWGINLQFAAGALALLSKALTRFNLVSTTTGETMLLLGRGAEYLGDKARRAAHYLFPLIAPKNISALLTTLKAGAQRPMESITFGAMSGAGFGVGAAAFGKATKAYEYLNKNVQEATTALWNQSRIVTQLVPKWRNLDVLLQSSGKSLSRFLIIMGIWNTVIKRFLLIAQVAILLWDVSKAIYEIGDALGTWRQLGKVIADFWEQVVPDWLSDKLEWLFNFLADLPTYIAEGLVLILATITKLISGLSLAIAELLDQLAKLAENLPWGEDTWSKSLRSQAASLREISSDLDEMQEKYRNFLKGAEYYREHGGFKELTDSFKAIGKNLDEINAKANNWKALSLAMTANVATMGMMRGYLKELNADIAKAEHAYGSLTDVADISSLADTFESLEEMYKRRESLEQKLLQAEKQRLELSGRSAQAKKLQLEADYKQALATLGVSEEAAKTGKRNWQEVYYASQNQLAHAKKIVKLTQDEYNKASLYYNKAKELTMPLEEYKLDQILTRTKKERDKAEKHLQEIEKKRQEDLAAAARGEATEAMRRAAILQQEYDHQMAILKKQDELERTARPRAAAEYTREMIKSYRESVEEAGKIFLSKQEQDLLAAQKMFQDYTDQYIKDQQEVYKDTSITWEETNKRMQENYKMFQASLPAIRAAALEKIRQIELSRRWRSEEALEEQLRRQAREGATRKELEETYFSWLERRAETAGDGIRLALSKWYYEHTNDLEAAVKGTNDALSAIQGSISDAWYQLFMGENVEKAFSNIGKNLQQAFARILADLVSNQATQRMTKMLGELFGIDVDAGRKTVDAVTAAYQAQEPIVEDLVNLERMRLQYVLKRVEAELASLTIFKEQKKLSPEEYWKKQQGPPPETAYDKYFAKDSFKQEDRLALLLKKYEAQMAGDFASAFEDVFQKDVYDRYFKGLVGRLGPPPEPIEAIDRPQTFVLGREAMAELVEPIVMAIKEGFEQATDLTLLARTNEAWGEYAGKAPGFAGGAEKIEKTGMALVHEGEKIIPAEKVAKYGHIVKAAAAEYNVPEALIWGIMKVESGYDPTAVNKTSGAIGLMQLMPDNLKGVEDPFDPATNIFRGVETYKWFEDYFRKRYYSMPEKTIREYGLAGYFAGQGEIRRALERTGMLPANAREYVDKVSNTTTSIQTGLDSNLFPEGYKWPSEYIPAITYKPVAAYATGTEFAPKTEAALLHAGEVRLEKDWRDELGKYFAFLGPDEAEAVTSQGVHVAREVFYKNVLKRFQKQLPKILRDIKLPEVSALPRGDWVAWREAIAQTDRLKPLPWIKPKSKEFKALVQDFFEGLRPSWRAILNRSDYFSAASYDQRTKQILGFLGPGRKLDLYHEYLHHLTHRSAPLYYLGKNLAETMTRTQKALLREYGYDAPEYGSELISRLVTREWKASGKQKKLITEFFKEAGGDWKNVKIGLAGAAGAGGLMSLFGPDEAEAGMLGETGQLARKGVSWIFNRSEHLAARRMREKLAMDMFEARKLYEEAIASGKYGIRHKQQLGKAMEEYQKWAKLEWKQIDEEERYLIDYDPLGWKRFKEELKDTILEQWGQAANHPVEDLEEILEAKGIKYYGSTEAEERLATKAKFWSIFARVAPYPLSNRVAYKQARAAAGDDTGEAHALTIDEFYGPTKAAAKLADTVKKSGEIYPYKESLWTMFGFEAIPTLFKGRMPTKQMQQEFLSSALGWTGVGTVADIARWLYFSKDPKGDWTSFATFLQKASQFYTISGRQEPIPAFQDLEGVVKVIKEGYALLHPGEAIAGVGVTDASEDLKEAADRLLEAANALLKVSGMELGGGPAGWTKAELEKRYPTPYGPVRGTEPTSKPGFIDRWNKAAKESWARTKSDWAGATEDVKSVWNKIFGKKKPVTTGGITGEPVAVDEAFSGWLKDKGWGDVTQSADSKAKIEAAKMGKEAAAAKGKTTTAGGKAGMGGWGSSILGWMGAGMTAYSLADEEQYNPEASDFQNVQSGAMSGAAAMAFTGNPYLIAGGAVFGGAMSLSKGKSARHKARRERRKQQAEAALQEILGYGLEGIWSPVPLEGGKTMYQYNKMNPLQNFPTITLKEMFPFIGDGTLGKALGKEIWQAWKSSLQKVSGEFKNAISGGLKDAFASPSAELAINEFARTFGNALLDMIITHLADAIASSGMIQRILSGFVQAIDYFAILLQQATNYFGQQLTVVLLQAVLYLTEPFLRLIAAVGNAFAKALQGTLQLIGMPIADIFKEIWDDNLENIQTAAKQGKEWFSALFGPAIENLRYFLLEAATTLFPKMWEKASGTKYFAEIMKNAGGFFSSEFIKQLTQASIVNIIQGFIKTLLAPFVLSYKALIAGLTLLPIPLRVVIGIPSLMAIQVALLTVGLNVFNDLFIAFGKMAIKFFEPLIEAGVQWVNRLRKEWDLWSDDVRDMFRMGFDITTTGSMRELEQLKSSIGELQDILVNAFTEGWQRLNAEAGWEVFVFEFRKGIYQMMMDLVARSIVVFGLYLGTFAANWQKILKYIFTTAKTGFDPAALKSLIYALMHTATEAIAPMEALFKDFYGFFDEMRGWVVSGQLPSEFDISVAQEEEEVKGPTPWERFLDLLFTWWDSVFGPWWLAWKAWWTNVGAPILDGWLVKCQEWVDFWAPKLTAFVTSLANFWHWFMVNIVGPFIALLLNAWYIIKATCIDPLLKGLIVLFTPLIALLGNVFYVGASAFLAFAKVFAMLIDVWRFKALLPFLEGLQKWFPNFGTEAIAKLKADQAAGGATAKVEGMQTNLDEWYTTFIEGLVPGVQELLTGIDENTAALGEVAANFLEDWTAGWDQWHDDLFEPGGMIYTLQQLPGWFNDFIEDFRLNLDYANNIPVDTGDDGTEPGDETPETPEPPHDTETPEPPHDTETPHDTQTVPYSLATDTLAGFVKPATQMWATIEGDTIDTVDDLRKAFAALAVDLSNTDMPARMQEAGDKFSNFWMALSNGLSVTEAEQLSEFFNTKEYATDLYPWLRQMLWRGGYNQSLSMFNDITDFLEDFLAGSMQTGGAVRKTGLYKLHEGEIVFPPQLVEFLQTVGIAAAPQVPDQLAAQATQGYAALKEQMGAQVNLNMSVNIDVDHIDSSYDIEMIAQDLGRYMDNELRRKRW